MAQTLEERLRSRLSSAIQQAAEEVSGQAFSGYLVKRLIVDNSFRNVIDEDGTVRGFQVRTKNKLGAATIVGATPLKVDGETFGVERIVIEKDKLVLRASEISERLPISVSFGDEFVIRVVDEQGLESGPHKIQLGLKMVGLGVINVSYDDTLVGEGRSRVRRAEPKKEAAGDAEFADVMRRTIESASAHIGRRTLAECAKTLRGIVLDLTDIGEKYGVAISPDGEASFVAGGIDGDRVLTISISRASFHAMAHNKLNPGIAYARGDIRLTGVPLLKLRGMDTLITSIFQGYRAASEGLEFDEVAGAPGGGAFEEILGITLSAFDELLKVLDRAFGAFGMSYFREKALNRMEWLWEVLDREIRKLFSFGREAEESEGIEEKPVVKKAEKPSAPGKSLQDRLRERITAVVDTAVSAVSRTAVSGYLVKRLIAPGSFRNYSEDGSVAGFEVRLKNKISAAAVIGFSEMVIDGEAFALDMIEIHKGKRVVPAAEVSDRNPLQVEFGDELLVRVRRPGGLGAGKHRVRLGVDMVGLGGVDVDYEDSITE